MPGFETPPYLAAVREHLGRGYTRNPSRPGDRRAAVLLPLLGDGPDFVGILRVDDGTRHGGQFALPGGMIEPGESTRDCALREAREELGLEEVPEIIGDLGEFNTNTSRFRVVVHVATMTPPRRWRPQEDEVAAIVQLPVKELIPEYRRMPAVEDVWHLPIESGFDLDLESYVVAGTGHGKGRGQRLGSGNEERELPFIWGLTARILHDFLRRVWLPSTGAAES